MRLIEFLINHFEILIPVAIIVISALSSSKKKKGGSANRPLSPQERQQQAAEEQRVREIQEEIRRKIAERTGAGPSHQGAPQASRSRPVQTRTQEPGRSSQGHKTYAPAGQSRQMDAPRSSHQGHKHFPDHDDPHGIPLPGSHRHAPQSSQDRWAAKVAEQERLVQEQLEKAKRLEGRLKGGSQAMAASVIGGAFPGSEGASSSVATGGAQSDLMKDLRDTKGQRKAILLREILGTPVGMRKPGTSLL